MSRRRAGIHILALLLGATLSCSPQQDKQPLPPSAEEKSESAKGESSVEASTAPSSKMKLDSPTVGSGCTMESIRATVQTRKVQITQCYTEAALKDPSVGGRIALQLGIGPSGKLLQRGVVESELPESVAACILKTLRGLQFPGAFEKPCGIVYPLVFSSSKQRAPKGTRLPE